MPRSVPTIMAPVLISLLLSWLPAAVRAAPEDAVTPDRPAEYMIYQYPGTALVIRIDIDQAEFGLRTVGPEGALVKATAVAGRRLGPVFQFVDDVDAPRQLMIEVTPARLVRRQDIHLELMQFAAGDRNTAAVTRAYRLFSLGLETVHSHDSSTWAMKSYSLRNAAEIFAGLGMEEMRLWSEYFAAHLVLHQLDDRLLAIEFAQEIQVAAERAGLERIELAATVLEGEALLRRLAEADDRQIADLAREAHDLFPRLADRARKLKLPSEQGRAWYEDGRVYEREGLLGQAIDRYQEALAVIENAADTELLNEVRGAAALAYEARGSTSGALEMLDDIAADLESGQASDAERELAARLTEKGRLLNDTYRYGEAVAELRRALELQRADVAGAAWGATALELAWSYYALGQADAALRLIEEALPRTPLRDNLGLLVRAYGSMAAMQRVRGRFEQVRQARQMQLSLLGDRPGRAAALLESALDARYRDGPRSDAEEKLLRRSQLAARKDADPLTEKRAALQRCLLDLERGQKAGCDLDSAGNAKVYLQDSGIPRVAMEAGLTWSRILSRLGRAAAAHDELESLFGTVYWYLRALPGVLDTWYAENHEALFDEYLELALQGGGDADRKPAGAERALLALEHIRAVEAVALVRGEQSLLDPGTDGAIRASLAERVRARGGEVSVAAASVNRQIATSRQQAAAGEELLTGQELERLLAGLDRSGTLLTYLFSHDRAYAVLAGRNDVRRVRLSSPDRIRELLAQVREGANAAAGPGLPGRLDELGRLLLGPLRSGLNRRVYLLPAGPLLGVPFDALRLDGEFLATGHSLVNLLGLRSLGHGEPELRPDFRDRVFLAGAPRGKQDPFSFEQATSPEIRAVTDEFVGAGLHIVQGAALQADEFRDERFTAAALVHLAIPGYLDLAFPERSRLLLSSVPESGGAAVLTPAVIRSLNPAAGLVVLSATALNGLHPSPHASRLALAADFLDAGAASVLVSLARTDENVAAGFTTGVYRRLDRNPVVADAVAQEKRVRIASVPEADFMSWAGFQLYIR